LFFLLDVPSRCFFTSCFLVLLFVLPASRQFKTDEPTQACMPKTYVHELDDAVLAGFFLTGEDGERMSFEWFESNMRSFKTSELVSLPVG
jgi:hypothetical protein